MSVPNFMTIQPTAVKTSNSKPHVDHMVAAEEKSGISEVIKKDIVCCEMTNNTMEDETFFS